MRRNLRVNILGASEYIAENAKDIIADEFWYGISGKVTASEPVFNGYETSDGGYDIQLNIDKDIMFDFDISEGIISFWNGTSIGDEKWEIDIDDCFKIEIL